MLSRLAGLSSELSFAFALFHWNFKNKLILQPMTMQLQLQHELFVHVCYYISTHNLKLFSLCHDDMTIEDISLYTHTCSSGILWPQILLSEQRKLICTILVDPENSIFNGTRHEDDRSSTISAFKRVVSLRYVHIDLLDT